MDECAGIHILKKMKNAFIEMKKLNWTPTSPFLCVPLDKIMQVPLLYPTQSYNLASEDLEHSLQDLDYCYDASQCFFALVSMHFHCKTAAQTFCLTSLWCSVIQVWVNKWWLNILFFLVKSPFISLLYLWLDIWQCIQLLTLLLKAIW